jgi:hypothetical protein
MTAYDELPRRGAASLLLQLLFLNFPAAENTIPALSR